MTSIDGTRKCSKILISGEHSLCYGGPAIGMPVPLYLSVNSFYTEGQNSIGFENSFYTVKDMLAGRQTPDFFPLSHRLSAVTVASFIERFSGSDLVGCRFQVSSDIPQNYGLGSSGALILAFLTECLAIASRSLFYQDLWQWARSIEHLQHGQSSGFDCALIETEKPLFYQPKQGLFSVLEKPKWPFVLVFSGASLSTTKDCVQHVANQKKPVSFWRSWEGVTMNIYDALLKQDLDAFGKYVYINHSFLCEIGVVPRKVASFLACFQKGGGIGKLCGSGSVIGNGGGVLLLLCLAPHLPLLKELCLEYEYSFLWI